MKGTGKTIFGLMSPEIMVLCIVKKKKKKKKKKKENYGQFPLF